ncbi:MAG: hypothetical protein A2857_05255 [Candidatus Levybacteria bacterium RIFCSPHIGHO2_01_FULL_36_15]|nr:MAG: hypothetical protein A2857_05255 [Candidatus Levybacteria bacterium RIFCSPHIGHO2_01_FULL_36_15]OGH38464.1 MAG: hypothetical protein A2905_01505 [Candidatus Levybacteria bacterium RIFCSPLOWO2_01_FULL_36_10]
MKIGIYDPYLDTLGGGEKYMLTAAQCLSASHTVSIFWDKTDDLKQAEEKFALDLNKIKIEENIFSPKVSLLKRLKKTSEFNVIIFLSDGSIPIVLSKKLILHFQFPIEWVDTSSLTFNLKKSRIDMIICNSRFTKEYIDRKMHKKSIVVYPPVDINMLEYNTNKENLILTVGRYSRMPSGGDFKKQEILIDVFKKMIDQGLKSWKLCIVTSNLPKDEIYVNELEKRAKGYPVKIHRSIKNNEILQLYNKARIYWHAAGFGEDLEKHPERAEHFGISTAEAMVAGCVPVVYGAGGQMEIVKDKTDGFLWNNTEELVEKTQLIINNNILWSKLSENAKKTASCFNKQRFCSEINSVL